MMWLKFWGGFGSAENVYRALSNLKQLHRRIFTPATSEEMKKFDKAVKILEWKGGELYLLPDMAFVRWGDKVYVLRENDEERVDLDDYLYFRRISIICLCYGEGGQEADAELLDEYSKEKIVYRLALPVEYESEFIYVESSLVVGESWLWYERERANVDLKFYQSSIYRLEKYPPKEVRSG